MLPVNVGVGPYEFPGIYFSCGIVATPGTISVFCADWISQPFPWRFTKKLRMPCRGGPGKPSGVMWPVKVQIVWTTAMSGDRNLAVAESITSVLALKIV